MNNRPLFSYPLRKRFLVLLLIVFIPFLTIVIAKGIRKRNDEIDRAQNGAFIVMQSLAAQQEQLVTTTETVLTMLAQSREVQTLDKDACTRLFADVKRRYPYFETIYATTPDGTVFAASRQIPTGLNLSDRKQIRDAIASRSFSAGEYIVGRISSAVALSYAYPVFDDKQNLIAIVGAGFSVKNYSGFISELNLGEGYNVVITDWKGVRLFRWPESEKAPVGQQLSPEGFALISGSEPQGFHEWMSPDGVQRVHAFRQMRLRKGAPPYAYLAVGIPKRQILQHADLVLMSNVLLVLVGASAILVFAWRFGSVALLQPINQLVDATRRFGTGDTSVRSGLPYTEDELGQLAKSFDEMAVLLEKRNKERQQAEELLTRANLELERRVEERTAELAASSQRLKLHRDLSPLAIIEWNLAKEAIDWNPAAERIFGYSPQEAIGRNGPDLLLAPEARHKALEVWDELLSRKGQAHTTIENRTKSGKTIFCEWHNTALVDASGEVIGVSSVVQDVTEARQLEQQLLQAQKMEAIGRLAGGVAHDFNNLLMVISSYTELLLTTLHDERQTRYGEQVIHASRKAADLTRQLLAFSRKQVIAPRVLNLNALVADMGKMLPRLIGEDVDLDIRLAEELLNCKADQSQIEQVVLNLAVNARDAMPGGGRLVLETSNVLRLTSSTDDNAALPAKQYVALTVTDNGSGISPEIREHIFEPFFTTKDVGKGTGLGLSTVYGILEQNGGFITVDSTPGSGSTFKVYLPAVNDSLGENDAQTDEHAKTQFAATILLVEDEPALRRAGAEYLETLGYKVLVAGDGEEALRCAHEFSGTIHVLLTDVVMPRINGAELAKRIRAFRPNIRVIYMSGYSDDLLLEKQGRVESDYYLQKPFSFQLLGEKVKQIFPH